MARVTPQELEELLEEAQDVANVGAYACEFRKRVITGSVPESYERGDLSFHLHLRLAAEGLDLEPCEACLTYHNALVLSEQRLEGDYLRASVRQEQGLEDARVSAPDEQTGERPMPVVACHLGQNGQRVIARVRSVVPLQLLDECDGRALYANELPGLVDVSGERLRIGQSLGADGFGEDWEGVNCSRLLVVRLDECPDEVFQNGARLVERFASQDAHARRRQLSILDVCRVPFGLEVDLEPHCEGVRTTPRSKLRLKGAQMLVSPCRASPEAVLAVALPSVTLPYMAKEKPVPTEKTPKGLEVPVPKRREFFANLKKVAKVPRKRSTPASGPEK